MAFSLPYTKLNINTPGALVPNIGSTLLAGSGGHVVVGTATATSTSIPQTQRWLFGDYTSTQAIPATTQVRSGGIGDFGFEHQQYRALVNFKSLTGYGSATSTSAYGLVVALEAATSTASWVGTGSTGAMINGYVIDSKFVVQTSNTSTGNIQTVYLFGTLPTANGAQFARVSFYNVGSAGQTAPSSTAIDVVIEGI